MRILIAINGSTAIDQVLQFSKQFVCCSSDPATLLNVYQPGDDRPPPQNNTISKQAAEIFETHCLQTKVRIGKTEEEILREIKSGDYDLVIYGLRRFRRLARIFRGSVAYHIIEQAPCSVMVVRGRLGPIRKILLCDSGAGESRLLKQFTSQAANLLKGQEEITILHVMSQISAGPGVRGIQLRAEANELIQSDTPEGGLLARDFQSLMESGLHSTPKIRHGLVVEEILSEARSGDYDLVVIGYQHQKWQHYLLDDLTHQIIDQVDRPVWVIK